MAIRKLQVMVPAALLGAALGAGGLMLASRGSGIVAPSNAAPTKAAATRYDRLFGNIYYKVPAGYRAVQTKGGVIMVRQADLISGELGGFLTITQGFPLDAKIKAQFKANGKKTAIQAIAIAVGNLADDPDAKLTEPQLVNDAAHVGYEGYSLQSRSQDKDAGKTRFTQYVIILTADRADVIMRVAYDSQANYAAFNAGFESLATSIEPKNSGAPPPARLAAALPTDLAVITPRQEKAGGSSAQASGNAASGAGVVCRVETHYRTFFGNMAGGMPTATRYPVTQRICRRNGQIVE